MKIYRIFVLAIIINSVWGISYDLLGKSNNNSNNRDLDFHTIIGVMVDFPYEDTNDPNTTGRGHFLSEIDADLISSRCDGFLVDPPPHNADYFRDQIQAVKNYFSFNINSSNENIFDFHVLEQTFRLSKTMRDYSVSDSTIGELFSEAVDLAFNEGDLLSQDWYEEDEANNYLFVIFHAGVGQDISFPYLDPANYDIPSAYIDSQMLNESWEYYDSIQHGLVLPETLNHIYYNIIEDLFYGNDNFCNYQLGMTGLFSLLLGYAMDLPVLYNTDNGEAGVGSFGLMDYGSNNGLGVIPSPISPWSKIYKGWASAEEILDFSQVSLGVDEIGRIDVSDSEYLLIENKNNWIEEDIDLDSLRNKYKNWDSDLQDSIPGYFFDILTEKLSSDQIDISPVTNVILGVNNYNYGLPGSGILMWSINESLINELNIQSGINNNPDNKAIQIKEADGAQDIGQDCYHWNPSFCDILTKGWQYDLWYNGNGQYLINNPIENEVRLNDNTNPNLRLGSGALSLLEISQFSDVGNSMSFDYSSYTPSFSVSYIPSNSEIEIIGSGSINGDGCLYYIEEGLLYEKCYGGEPNLSDIDFDFNEHSKVLVYNNISYAASENQYLLTNEETPIVSGDGLDDLDVLGYFNSINYTDQLDNCLSAGDFDNDGLDECAYIDGQYLHIENSNNTSIDNFPVEFLFDNYENNILIANIVNDQASEIIFKADGAIHIMNINGEIHTSVATSNQSRLRLLPNWGNSIVLIDGNRLLLFPYDAERTYWTSKYGTDWDFPIVNSSTLPREIIDMANKTNFYNYPNPVRDNTTTFRFFNNTGNMDPRIQLYNIEGLLVEIIYPDSFQNVMNEYSEIPMSFLDYEPGVYFAELKDGNKSVAIIKVAIIP